MANEVQILVTAKNESSAGFKSASSDAKEYGNSVEGAGEKADVAEQRTLGLKDTIDGTAAIMAGPGKDGIGAYLQGWADLASGLSNLVIPALGSVVTAEGRAAIATSLAAAKTKVAAVATKAYAAVQWVLNAALSANPIGLVVIALTALVVGLVIAYKRSATFRAIVQSAFATVRQAASLLWAGVRLYFGLIAGVFNLQMSIARRVAGAVRSAFSGLVSFIRSIPGRIRGALSGMFNPITNAARNAVATARNLLNGLLSFAQSIPGRIGNSLKSAIPGFAHGGIVGQAASGGTRSGLTMTGEHGPELLRLPPGTQVRSNPDTRRIGAGAEDGSGGGTLRILLDGTGLLAGLRKEIRAKGGNVQTVLGTS
jgi:phage-related protein